MMAVSYKLVIIWCGLVWLVWFDIVNLVGFI